MTFQQWVMSCCGGRPSEAIKLIDAVSGTATPRALIHRAMRQPATFDPKLAWYIHLASGKRCTVAELTDLALVRAGFEYTHPDLQMRALELSIMRESRRLVHAQSKALQAQAECERLDRELQRLRTELAAVGGGAPKRRGKRPVAA